MKILRSFPIKRSKGKSIFLVTVLSIHGTETRRSRTWGWYPTATEASKAVVENYTDIFEVGYYTHAVVEEFPPGFISLARSERWFLASYKKGRLDPLVREVKKPKHLRQTIGFGLG